MSKSTILLIIILLTIPVGGYIWKMNQINPPANSISPVISSGVTSPVPTTSSPSASLDNQETVPNLNGVVPPIAQFKPRITKKFFGTYVTPTNSPVTPERFTGYHTGVDVEYQDVETDVPVYAISDGVVVSSESGSGYGGVMVIKHQIKNQTLFATYGHLRLSSMLKTDSQVKFGQQIGVLGTGYSPETDGERRHLHFGISIINTNRGYVATLSELHTSWIDPLSLYP